MSLSKVTILITSFLRPGYLADCLAGIKKNLPEVKVIVIDDGGMSGEGIISMPFDSGLSAKRNAGVAATKTKYLLMGSDDFDFSTAEARRGIEKMVAVLDNNRDIDVAGGRVNGDAYEGNLTVAPGQYISQTRLPAYTPPVTKCDLVVNYFVARTKSILPFPWDERMKIGGEHGDWFLTLKDNGLTVVVVEGVNITTLPYDSTKEHPTYAKYRARAKDLGHRIFLRKRGVSEFYGSGSPPPEPLQLPKFLIAIVACHKNADKVAAQRRTWLKSTYGVDYKIFYGEGATREPEADEVFLDVKDDYVSLPSKMKAIYQWVLDNGYEFVCKVDDDVFVEVPRLVTAGWQKHDYTGRANHAGNPPWASGACYWLSKRAMQIIADAPLTSDTAEDRWVGSTLYQHGIHVNNDLRYSLIIYTQPHWDTAVTACICRNDVDMEMVEEGFIRGTSPRMMVVPPDPALMPKRVPNGGQHPDWRDSLLEKKVRALFQRFRYVVATDPASSHYKALCKIYPEHMEERVETPEGLRLIFIVDK